MVSRNCHVVVGQPCMRKEQGNGFIFEQQRIFIRKGVKVHDLCGRCYAGMLLTMDHHFWHNHHQRASQLAEVNRHNSEAAINNCITKMRDFPYSSLGCAWEVKLNVGHINSPSECGTSFAFGWQFFAKNSCTQFDCSARENSIYEVRGGKEKRPLVNVNHSRAQPSTLIRTWQCFIQF